VGLDVIENAAPMRGTLLLSLAILTT